MSWIIRCLCRLAQRGRSIVASPSVRRPVQPSKDTKDLKLASDRDKVRFDRELQRLRAEMHLIRPEFE